MRVEVIEDWQGFQALQSAWDDVYRTDPEAQIFLAHRYLSDVLTYLEDGWRVLAVRQGDQYLAFMPLRVTTYRSKRHGVLCNELVMPARVFYADYTGWLCRPESEAQAIPLLAEALQQLNWAQLEIKYLRTSAHRLDLFLSAFRGDSFIVQDRPSGKNRDDIDNDICPAVDLPGDFEEYQQAKLSSSTRSKMRRMMRKVEQSDDLEITETTPQTIERDIEALLRMWRATWAERKGDRVDKIIRRYRVILMAALRAGQLYLPVLWSKGEAVAALATYVDRKHNGMYFKLAGRDPDFREVHAGIVMHGHSIRWGIDNGIRRYDFLRGDEPYKYHYGSTDTRLQNIRIYTQSRLNLNDRLDPLSLDEAAAYADRYDRQDRPADAEKVRQQIRESAASNGPNAQPASVLSNKIVYTDGHHQTGYYLPYVDGSRR